MFIGEEIVLKGCVNTEGPKTAAYLVILLVGWRKLEARQKRMVRQQMRQTH